MNKGIIWKVALIIVPALIILGIAVGCEVLDKEAVAAQIDNPNDVYMSVDGVEITNGEMYKYMKNIDGLTYVYNMIDDELLKAEIAAITPEDVEEAKNLEIYETNNPEIIAEIQENTELDRQRNEAFNNKLEVLGFDSSNDDEVKAYFMYELAHKAYTVNKIKNETETGTDYYVNPVKFEELYEETVRGEVCSLDLRFVDDKEAEDTFRDFNLVFNYKSGIGEYFGTTDIDDVPRADFDETNTNELSDEDVFAYYVKVYNHINQWNADIPEDISMADFCTNYTDIAVKNFEEMTEGLTENDALWGFGDYIFETLDLEDDETVPYSFTANRSFGDYVIMSFKISETPAPDFSTLSAAEVEELAMQVYEDHATDNLISQTIANLYKDNGLVIYDPFLNLDYRLANDESFDNLGDEKLVAKIDSLDITAQKLFEYMEPKVGVFYSVEAAKVKVLVDSDAYVQRFGDSRDYMNSKNDNMIELRDNLRTMKSRFVSNQFASAGYSSSDMNWEEFLFAAFNAESAAEVMESIYVAGDLQYNFVYPGINYPSALDYIQDQIDNHFSLDVKHIQFYIDYDFDFEQDDYLAYEATLSGQELADLTAIKVALENAVLDKIDDDMSLEDIVEEYNEAIIGDSTLWSDAKAHGFFIETVDLGEVNNNNVIALGDEFEAAMIRLYADYTTEPNNEEASFTDDRIVKTDFGLHIIQVEKGANFELPTAEYTVAAGDEGAYSDGIENSNMIPTQAQIDVYLQIKYDTENGIETTELLPSSVSEAIDYYFGAVYSAYTNTTGFSIAMTEYLLDNTVTYEVGNTAKVAELEHLLDVLYSMNYPELFDKDAE